MARADRLNNEGELILEDDPLAGASGSDQERPIIGEEPASEEPADEAVEEAPMPDAGDGVGGGGMGSTAGEYGEHDPDPVAAGIPDAYEPYTPDLAPVTDPTLGFKRKLPRMSGASDAQSFFTDAPSSEGEQGSLIEALLRELGIA